MTALSSLDFYISERRRRLDQKEEESGDDRSELDRFIDSRRQRLIRGNEERSAADIEHLRGREGAVGNAYGGLTSGIQSGVAGLAAPIARNVFQNDEVADQLQGYSAALTGAQQANVQERIDAGELGDMPYLGAVRKSLNRAAPGVGNSVTQMTLGGLLPGGPVAQSLGMAGTFAASERDSSYYEGRQKLMTEPDAADMANVSGGIEGGIMLAFQGLGKFIPAAAGLEGMLTNPAATKMFSNGIMKAAGPGLKTLAYEEAEEIPTFIAQAINKASSMPGAEDSANWTGEDGTFFTSPMWEGIQKVTEDTAWTVGLMNSMSQLTEVDKTKVGKFAKAASRRTAAMMPESIKTKLKERFGTDRKAAAEAIAAAEALKKQQQTSDAFDRMNQQEQADPTLKEPPGEEILQERQPPTQNPPVDVTQVPDTNIVPPTAEVPLETQSEAPETKPPARLDPEAVGATVIGTAPEGVSAFWVPNPQKPGEGMVRVVDDETMNIIEPDTFRQFETADVANNWLDKSGFTRTSPPPAPAEAPPPDLLQSEPQSESVSPRPINEIQQEKNDLIESVGEEEMSDEQLQRLAELDQEQYDAEQAAVPVVPSEPSSTDDEATPVVLKPTEPTLRPDQDQIGPTGLDQDQIETELRPDSGLTEWDSLPDEAKSGFESVVLAPLREQVAELDEVRRKNGARYSWEVATKTGKVGEPHKGSEGLARWKEAAAEGEISPEMADANLELVDLVRRLDEHRGWGDEVTAGKPDPQMKDDAQRRADALKQQDANQKVERDWDQLMQGQQPGLTPEEAQVHLRRLDAAPGDNPAVRGYLESIIQSPPDPPRADWMDNQTDDDLAAKPSDKDVMGMPAVGREPQLDATRPFSEQESVLDAELGSRKIELKDGDATVGYIAFGNDLNGYATINMVDVNPEYRGRGISTELYRKALTSAKAHGKKGLASLDVNLKSPEKTKATRKHFVVRESKDKADTKKALQLSGKFSETVHFIESERVPESRPQQMAEEAARMVLEEGENIWNVLRDRFDIKDPAKKRAIVKLAGPIINKARDKQNAEREAELQALKDRPMSDARKEARERTLAKNQPLTAAEFKQKLVETAPTPEVGEANYQLVEARAKAAGETVDEYVGRRIADVRSSDEADIGDDALLQDETKGPLWHMKSRQVIEETMGQPGKMGDKALPGQILSLLKKKGVKEEELEWSGLTDLLQGGKRLTKQEVLNTIDNGIQLSETMLQEQIETSPEAVREQAVNNVREFADLEGVLTSRLDDALDRWLNNDADANARSTINDFLRQNQQPNLTETLTETRREMSNPEGSGGEPRHSGYVVPGGKDQRELLIQMPAETASKKREAEIDAEIRELSNWPNDPNTAKDPNDAVYLQNLNEEWERLQAQHTDTFVNRDHYEQENVIAHQRFNERTDPNTGERVMHLEENQSDWHQSGRKQGYKDKEYRAGQRREIAELKAMRDDVRQKRQAIEKQIKDAAPRLNEDGNIVAGMDEQKLRELRRQAVEMQDDEKQMGTQISTLQRGGLVGNAGFGNPVPDAPFKQTKAWAMLGMKRAIQHAAENGFDRVAWTTGDTQADRYDLSKQVSKMEYDPSSGWVNVKGLLDEEDDGRWRAAFDGPKPADIILQVRVNPEGKVIESRRLHMGQEDMMGKSLDSIIGKDAAKGLLEGTVDPSGMIVLEGDGLKVGGQWTKDFYDRMLPGEVGKFIKKFGSKVEMTDIGAKGEWEQRYEGPTRTLEDVESVLELSKKSGGNQFETPFAKLDQAVNTVSTSRTLDAILAGMGRGESFTEAMKNHSSPFVATLFGGKIDGGSPDIAKQSHSFAITPEMRASALKYGQPMFQKPKGGPAKGAIEFQQDGRAIIHAFESQDASTGLHELYHVFRQDLAGNDKVIAEEWTGVKDGKWTREADEMFARGGENYHRTGEAPTAALKDLFDRFKTWLQDVYKTLTGSAIDVKISKEMKGVYDRLFVPEGETATTPDVESQTDVSVEAGIKSLESQLKKQHGDLEILSLREGDNYIELSNMRVDPEKRNQGTGNAVVKSLQEYATKVGKPVVLTTQAETGKKGRLNKFYEKKLGFKKVGKKRDFTFPAGHTHVWTPTTAPEAIPGKKPRKTNPPRKLITAVQQLGGISTRMARDGQKINISEDFKQAGIMAALGGSLDLEQMATELTSQGYWRPSDNKMNPGDELLQALKAGALTIQGEELKAKEDIAKHEKEAADEDVPETDQRELTPEEWEAEQESGFANEDDADADDSFDFGDKPDTKDVVDAPEEKSADEQELDAELKSAFKDAFKDKLKRKPKGKPRKKAEPKEPAPKKSGGKKSLLDKAKANKKRTSEKRKKSTEALKKALEKLNNPPKPWKPGDDVKMNIGMDPDFFEAVVNATVDVIDDGIATFAEYIAEMVDSLTLEQVQNNAHYFENAWTEAGEVIDELDAAGKVLDIFPKTDAPVETPTEDAPDADVEETTDAPPEINTDKVLADAGLVVTETIDRGKKAFKVTGETFKNKTVLKGLGGKYNGREEIKFWTFRDGDPSARIAAELAGAAPPVGGGSVGSDPKKRRSDNETSAEDVERQRRRRSADATADVRRADSDLVDNVEGSTQELIKRGIEFGIPEEIVLEQIADIGQITDAYDRGEAAFLLANAPGTGKTFVLGGTIREILKKNPNQRVMYVTMNKDLIEQIQEDLKDYGINSVEFITYNTLSKGKRPDASDAVLIFDEAHNVKDVKKAKRAKAAQVMMSESKMAILASATPFENPVEAAYLDATGMFSDEGGHHEWAKLYGADVTTTEYYDKRGNLRTREFLKWSGGKAKIKHGVAAREWMKRRGVFVQRKMKLPPETVKTQFHKSPVDEYHKDLIDRVVKAYGKAGEPLDGQQQGGDLKQIGQHQANTLKRLLEAGKVEHAISRAKELIAEGKQVTLFVETKGDRHIGRYRKSNDSKGPLYSYPEMQPLLGEWARAAGAARRMGKKPPPRPFADFIEEIARVMHDAGIDENLPSVPKQLEAAFDSKEVVWYTGDQTPARAKKNLDAWKANEKKLLIATMAKGGTGLSLHSTDPNMPERVQIGLNLPWTGTGVEQTSGRLARYGTAKPVMVEWLFADNVEFEKKIAGKVGGRMRDMGAVVSGDVNISAEALAGFDFDTGFKPGDSFEDAYEESTHVVTTETDELYRKAEALEGNRKAPKDKSDGFYETPFPVAAMMQEIATVGENDSVLEPSAGTGNLLKLLPRNTSITANEMRESRRQDLEKNIPNANTLGKDFIELTKDDVGATDVVLMNPPFERQLGDGGVGPIDAAHVRHAFDMLDEGGRLVSLMGEGVFFRTAEKDTEFRQWLNEQGATVIRMPNDTFKKSGTSVRSRLVVIDKVANPVYGRTDLTLDSMKTEDLREMAASVNARQQPSVEEDDGPATSKGARSSSGAATSRGSNKSSSNKKPPGITNRPFAKKPPETEKGTKLVNRISNDIKNDTRTVGMRSVVDFVNEAAHTVMLVGRTQLSKKYPAHFEGDKKSRGIYGGAVIRSMSGSWQLNFHEAGHAISNWLRDTDPKLLHGFTEKLKDVARQPGNASSISAEEGFAEVIRRYVTGEDIPGDLWTGLESKMKKQAPELIQALNDAHRAYALHRSRPLEHQSQANQNDQPSKKGRQSKISESVYGLFRETFGDDWVTHSLNRKIYLGIAGPGLAKYDPTGISELVMGAFSKKHAAQQKYAREVMRGMRNKSTDFEAAYQARMHVTNEVDRAMGGVATEREGIRVLLLSDGFDQFSGGQIQALKNAGYNITDEMLTAPYGEFLHMSEQSFSTIKHKLKDDYSSFETYVQDKVALYRYEMSRMDYPGRTEHKPPKVLAQGVKDYESDNPTWKGHFKEVQTLMDQMLLIGVMSGEHSIQEAIDIKKKNEDYAPLPRQRDDEGGGSGRTDPGSSPTSGVMRTRGSALEFMPLEVAVEKRVRRSYEAYYENAKRVSILNMAKKINSDSPITVEDTKVPGPDRYHVVLTDENGSKVLSKFDDKFDAEQRATKERVGKNSRMSYDFRKSIGRLMLPLKLDTKKVATLSPQEQLAIIADGMNRTLAEELGHMVHPNMSARDVQNLLESEGEEFVTENDINLEINGKPIYRSTAPNARNVVTTFRGGKLQYHQVTNQLLYNYFSSSPNINKHLQWVATFIGKPLLPWKRLITQNLAFAFKNVPRDATTAMLFGSSGKAVIPGMVMGVAIVNRLKGDPDGHRAQVSTELLSKSLDHTRRDAHGTLVDSFKGMMAEGITDLPWSEMGGAQIAAELPGVVMSTVMKPADMINWLTGGRYVSALSESLSREGAFILSKREGNTTARASREFDRVTGQFIQRQPRAAAAAVARLGGFLNPALQATSQYSQVFSDPDPKMRAKAIAITLPSVALMGSAAAAINYLVAMAMMDDDEEKEEFIARMKERQENEKLAYMSILGVLKIPFDHGLTGGVASFAHNSIDDWLYEVSHQEGTNRAKGLMNRLLSDIALPTDFVHPFWQIWTDLARNHSEFMDADIVPKRLVEAYPNNPELWTAPDVAEGYNVVSRSALGKLAGVSPLKLRYAVRGVFTSDASRLVGLFDGKDKKLLSRDTPIIGSLVSREPKGWSSRSIRSVVALDEQYDALIKTAENMIERGVTGKELDDVRERAATLELSHRAMLEVEHIWRKGKAVGTDEAKDAAQRKMTKVASDFLGENDLPKRQVGLMVYSATSPSQDGTQVSFEALKRLKLTRAEAETALADYWLERARATEAATAKKSGRKPRPVNNFRRTPTYHARLRLLRKQLPE